jgi:hypothetical protein
VGVGVVGVGVINGTGDEEVGTGGDDDVDERVGVVEVDCLDVDVEVEVVSGVVDGMSEVDVEASG